MTLNVYTVEVVTKTTWSVLSATRSMAEATARDRADNLHMYACDAYKQTAKILETKEAPCATPAS